ncbi:MAG: F0F1 ATP synthase subunit epsilon [Phycisphaeraceae bacterium]|nr:F0F1 ATP synthase subunit epsilon [Phycisphaeraceae bacterium]
MPGTITCSLITPEQEVFEKEASYVDLPAHDGQMGFMANRAPLLVKLGEGVLTVTGPAEETKVQISGGFAQMKGNTLAILTDKAEELG